MEKETILGHAKDGLLLPLSVGDGRDEAVEVARIVAHRDDHRRRRARERRAREERGECAGELRGDRHRVSSRNNSRMADRAGIQKIGATRRRDF